MGIVEDMKAAEEDVAFEVTQERWSAALVNAWRKDLSLAAAISDAVGLKRPFVSDDWDRARKSIGALNPSVKEFTSLRQPVRPWIANHATMANDALWDCDFDKAYKLIVRGGVRVSGKAINRREAKAEMKKDTAGIVVIRARPLSKKHDWNTVK